MPKKEKSIHIIAFSGKKADQENWFKKFLPHGKHEEYEKLLVSSGSMVGVDEVPMQNEYKNALQSDMDLDKGH